VFCHIWTDIAISDTMAFKPKSLMDIDIDSSSSYSLLPLKRYNSAPFINTTVSDISTVNSGTMTHTIDTVARWTFIAS